MPKNLSEFLTMMDERLWFRMIVCFLPPLVIVKLVGYSDVGSTINNATTAVLLVGVALYLFWGRIRGLSGAGSDDEAQETMTDEAADAVIAVTESSSAQQLEMLAELRQLCDEPQSESDRLIALEAAVNPQLSYAQATRNALVRKRILNK